MKFRNFEPIEITEHNLEQVLKEVKNNRRQRNISYNYKSSRSHAIFRIESQGQIIGVVDLAGCERIR
jgi:predicted acetyltransferase